MTANPHPRPGTRKSQRDLHLQTSTNGQRISVLGELLGEPSTTPGVHADEPGLSSERRDHPSQSFACHSEHATDLRMLDVRLTGGSRRALPYHYLEAVDFVPSEGMVLSFAMAKIRLEGYRLHAVYHGLLGHRVGHLQAVAPPPAEVSGGVVDDQGDAVITSLWFDEERSPA